MSLHQIPRSTCLGMIIKAINNNAQESRRELLMWLFEKAGKRNPNNTHYQFWQQHSHPIG
jgi:putative transposase